MQRLGRHKQADAFTAAATSTRTAIESQLWQKGSQLYAVNSGASAANLSNFYPDAQAQLFPGLVRLPTPEGREMALARRFVTAVGDAWKTCSADAFPHTILAAPLVAAGQHKTVVEFREAVKAKFSSFSWPWHIGEAGGYVAMLNALTNDGSAPAKMDGHKNTLVVT